MTVAEKLERRGERKGIAKGKIEGKIEGERKGKIEGERKGKIEGERKGKVEGIQEGRTGLIAKMLKLKFQQDADRWIDTLPTLSFDQLDLVAERILLADDIDEIFRF